MRIEEWKRREGGKVAIVFHELYANGPIWKTEFWTRPFQRQIVRRLVDVADCWITNCDRYHRILLHEFGAGSKPGGVIPVGSNIEPARKPDLGRVARLSSLSSLRIVSFGLPRTRHRAVRIHLDLLSKLMKEGRIHSLLLMGAQPDPKMHDETLGLLDAAGVRGLVEEAFDLSGEEISLRLLEQDVALLATPPDLIGKSGVYAACSLHGVRCVLPGDSELDDRVFLRLPILGSWEEQAREFKAVLESVRSHVPSS